MQLKLIQQPLVHSNNFMWLEYYIRSIQLFNHASWTFCLYCLEVQNYTKAQINQSISKSITDPGKLKMVSEIMQQCQTFQDHKLCSNCRCYMLRKSIETSGDISVLWPITFIWGSEVLKPMVWTQDHSTRDLGLLILKEMWWVKILRLHHLFLCFVGHS